MAEFPCTKEEWDLVVRLSARFVNDYYKRNPVEKDALRTELLDMLHGLRKKYGDHPAILETIADYTKDESEQIEYYNLACAAAAANSMPTIGIKNYLASSYTLSGQALAALNVLRESGRELATTDDSTRIDWIKAVSQAANAAENPPELVNSLRVAIDILDTYNISALDLRLNLAMSLLENNENLAAIQVLQLCRTDALAADSDIRDRWLILYDDAGSSHHSD